VRKDDCSLEAAQLDEIRHRASLLLNKAAAIGRYPTPVDEIVEVAGLVIEREATLDRRWIGRMFNRMPERVKMAADKLLGLLDIPDRRIHVAQHIHANKQTFVKLHETGHDFLPHQRKLFDIIADGTHELDPFTQDLFEREANNFACEVLFQLDGFARDAGDSIFGLRSALQLSKRYGASVYASIRRYVTTSSRACGVLIFEEPVYAADATCTLQLRRWIPSPKLVRTVGELRWKDVYGPNELFTVLVPDNRFTRPRRFQLNGPIRSHTCVVEVFNSTFELFYLICLESDLKCAELQSIH
jgi:hypothetical protein